MTGRSREIEHEVVYRSDGQYAGWPANYGMWSWQDEVVTGFTLGFHDNEGGFHSRDTKRPFVSMQSRSLDGGKTWETAEAPLLAPGDIAISAGEHMAHACPAPISEALNPPVQIPAKGDFSNPDFAMLCARSGLTKGAESWFYTSTDRCRSWNGPYTMPMFGQLGVAARTDYLTYGRMKPRRATLLLTSTKPDGKEGRVFCARTEDGGMSFKFISWLRASPPGFDIMPSSIELEPGHIICAIRSRDSSGTRNWIDLMRSVNDGLEWNYESTPVSNTGTGGNPPAMIRLSDGRICLIYGYRDVPSGIRAVLSKDNGHSWGKPIVLRNDGGNHDLGYPRVIQRTDGCLVIIYYYNDSPSEDRYIAATIWKP
ncbi:uncharacterized protein METZ01_LOCUS244601 [marine metagenome]|uniref:Sialidase domain-containing protein n=1 Tax=marine metagenome TaxID=408172 RepID=A0A382HXR2_9ZZZZ